MQTHRNPIPEIFLGVLGIAFIGVALAAVHWEAGAAAVELFIGSAVLTAALQDTLGNVVAGFAIHAEHPFKVDDWI